MDAETAYIFRSAKDIDPSVALAVRKGGMIGNRLRSQVLREFADGDKPDIAAAISSTLAPLIQSAMVMGHLLGIKRFFLMRKDLPALHKALSLSTADGAADILRKANGIDIDALQKQYGTQALRVCKDISNDADKKLRSTIADIIDKGSHKDEAVKILGAKFDAIGLTGQKPYQLETIFRTQSAIAYGAGKWQAEQAPDVQEILWGYKYVTVGDDRVRSEHAILEGTTLPKEDIFWLSDYPPNGWNCRCQAIPIFEERPIQAAPTEDEDGNPIDKDPDFAFNPGIVFGGDEPAVPTDVAQQETKETETEAPTIPTDINKDNVLDVLNQKIADYQPLIDELVAKTDSVAEQAKSDQAKANVALAKWSNAKEKDRALLDEFAKIAKKNETATPEQRAKNQLRVDQINMERRAIQQDRLAAAKEYNTHLSAVNETGDKRRAEAFKVLAVEKPITYVPGKHDNPDVEKYWKDGKYKATLSDGDDLKNKLTAANEFGKLVSSKNYGADTSKLIMYTLPDDGRAFAYKGKQVFTTAKESKEVVVHEIGHTIEVDTGCSKLLNAFVDARCGSEKPQSLQAKFGGNFDKDEMGREDKFRKATEAVGLTPIDAFYIGKTYKDGQTEVLSMGVQMMYRDAAAFAKADPQYFALIRGILTGELK